MAASVLFLLNLWVSQPPAPQPLGDVSPTTMIQNVEEILGSSTFRGAEVSVLISKLGETENEDLFAKNADTLLVPASNIKIVTTAAALHFLGPDYRFLTEVLGEMDDSGHVERLYLKGNGDPWLVPERVWYLASRLRYHGLRSIDKIVMDDSYFAGNMHANGVDQDHSSYAYMAPAGAVSVGFNAIQVMVKPGNRSGAPAEIMLDPISDYARVEGKVRTVTRGRSYLNVYVRPEGERSVVHAEGRLSMQDGGRSYWRRIDSPAIYAGEVFKSILKQVGVQARGSVSRGTTPEGSTRLFNMSSPRLADIVARLNKHSNNFMAAQVARAVGAKVHGAPGTWDKAEAAITSFLVEEAGLRRGKFKIKNASGLHDVNEFSARQMAKVLSYMHRRKALRPEFLASLAVAGGTGTLNSRMEEGEANMQLRAKTGTLSIASALSGFVQARSGESLVFSMIVNNYKTSVQDVWEAQDAIGELLARVVFGPDDNMVASSHHEAASVRP